MPRTRPMTATEIRIVGSLMEKEQTTPGQYPMTVAALINACNQKTNREPVTELTETEIWDTLDDLRKDVLVWRTDSARAVRWQHSLDRRWELDGRKKAVMTLLMLRGPQTPGELRSRSERMYAFPSVTAVETVLGELSEGFDALVAELPREPGQRETRWMHLVGEELPEGAADEDSPAASSAGEAPAPRSPLAEDRPSPAPRPAAPPAGERPAAPETTPASGPDEETAERLAALEETVERLRRDLDELRRALGVGD